MAVGVGIELAPSTVRVAILDRVGNQLKLVTAREFPCETANVEALTRVLAQARQTLRLSRPIVLGVPDASAIVATVNPLVTNPRRALLAVQFELQQQLPFELREAAWHYHWWTHTNGHAAASRSRFQTARQQRVPQTSSRQPSYEALVAAVRRPRLTGWLECCRASGLRVEAVAVNAVGLVNAWYQQRLPASSTTTSRSGVALIYLMGEQVAEWVAWTPASLQIISVTSGSREELWSDLAAAWESLRGQFAEPPASVWLAGGVSSNPADDEALAARAGLSVQRLSASHIVTGSLAPDAAARMVAAIGLGVQALGMARVPINLLASFQQEISARRIRRVAAVTSGVCAVVTIGLGISGMVEVRRRRSAVLAFLEQRELLYQRLRPELRGVLQRQQRTQQRSQQLEQLVRGSSALTQTMARVAESLPDRVWLTKLDWSKTEEGIDGLLEGRAKSFQDVTQLLDRLKGLPGVTAVKPLSTAVSPDASTGKEVIVFSVQVQSHRQADAAAEPTNAAAQRPGKKP